MFKISKRNCITNLLNLNVIVIIKLNFMFICLPYFHNVECSDSIFFIITCKQYSFEIGLIYMCQLVKSNEYC